MRFLKIIVMSIFLAVPFSCYAMQNGLVKLSSSPPALVMKRDSIRPISPAAVGKRNEFDIVKILPHYTCDAIIKASAGTKLKQD